MQRTVSAQLALRVDDDATLAFIVEVAGRPTAERLDLRSGGAALRPREVTDAAGTRIHVVDVGAGAVTLDYAATVDGRADAASVTELERLEYLRPSRYCEADRLAPTGLLRALDVPARLAAVYAPGLDPMDFHAVAEAYVDGAWHVVDATTLAPRSTLVRIATGRDAADTAFLSSYGGNVVLESILVSAVADVLPDDDVMRLERLG